MAGLYLAASLSYCCRSFSLAALISLSESPIQAVYRESVPGASKELHGTARIRQTRSGSVRRARSPAQNFAFVTIFI